VQIDAAQFRGAQAVIGKNLSEVTNDKQIGIEFFQSRDGVELIHVSWIKDH